MLENRPELKAQDLYEVARISRQGFFQAARRERHWEAFYERLGEVVRDLRERHNGMGSRALFYNLRVKGIGVNKFEKFMSSAGLTQQVKRRWIRTTDSGAGGPVFPNLTNGLKLDNINQLVVGDITYYLTKPAVYYITMLTDVYSMRIVGYRASDNMMADNNYLVLQQLFKLRGQHKCPGLIHHTDKGSQYRSTLYLRTLQDAGIEISMARNCLENPYAERINGIIKNDYLCFAKIQSFNDLQRELRKAVHKYNFDRGQEQLEWRTPAAFEQHILGLPPEKREVKTLYDFSKNEDYKKS
jgi:transposase InsO family protein